MVFQDEITIRTDGRGLHPITEQVVGVLPRELPRAGLLNVYIGHTSASLLIQENYDPTAKSDLETFINRIAPDGESWHRHTLEGADDTTSHMKSAITPVSLNIPIVGSQLGLGRWQGIYLWEHRTAPHSRTLCVTMLS